MLYHFQCMLSDYPNMEEPARNQRMSQLRLLPWRFLVALAFLALGLAFAQAPAVPVVAPGNPDFLQYLQTHQAVRPLTLDGYALGYLPSPISLSHLKGQQLSLTQTAIPASYDLRTLGRLTAIRNQFSCGDCWAFAAIGSEESALLPGETRDFSENNLKDLNG